MVILLLILIFSNTVMPVYALSSQKYFARIMTDDVMFYRNPLDNDNFANIYFELPKTYFVELLDSFNSQFYYAKYLDLEGYVKKESITSIIGSPKTPFLSNLNFRVYSEQSRDLRTIPSSTGGAENQVAYVQLYSQNLTYYGAVKGETLVDERTDVWFFCKYTAEKPYYGYVYSEFCDNGKGKAILIPENLEDVVYTTNPDFSVQPIEEKSLPVESKTTWIVIAVLCIPALIFVLMFLKGSKLSKDKKIKAKEVRDY